MATILSHYNAWHMSLCRCLLVVTCTHYDPVEIIDSCWSTRIVWHNARLGKCISAKLSARYFIARMWQTRYCCINRMHGIVWVTSITFSERQEDHKFMHTILSEGFCLHTQPTTIYARKFIWIDNIAPGFHYVPAKMAHEALRPFLATVSPRLQNTILTFVLPLTTLSQLDDNKIHPDNRKGHSWEVLLFTSWFTNRKIITLGFLPEQSTTFYWSPSHNFEFFPLSVRAYIRCV